LDLKWQRPHTADSYHLDLRHRRRHHLCLGRVLAEFTPLEPEVHGLVALMEIQASRTRARIGPSGEPILLLDQHRARWDQLLIRRGLAVLERAEQLGGARSAGDDV